MYITMGGSRNLLGAGGGWGGGVLTVILMGLGWGLTTGNCRKTIHIKLSGILSGAGEGGGRGVDGEAPNLSSLDLLLKLPFDTR